METQFIEGTLPVGHRLDFDPYFFNILPNLSLQIKSGWHSFYAVRSDKNLVRAQIHFHLHETTATSPYRNPFGSFEFSDAFTPRELYAFIKFTEDALKKKGIKKIQIKSYPQLYHSERVSLLHTFLINQGFMVEEAELSACIEINSSPLFESLSSYEKRVLRKQKKADLRFRKLAVERLHETYSFIESCRQERGQSLSMTIGQVEAAVRSFPDRFLLFGVFDKDSFAAASISVRINKTILYNFYPAHARQYDALSPVVGLTEGMYEFGQQEGIKLLDLGTSSLRNKPNFSLLDFKLNLGAKPTPKFTFVKNL